MWIKGSDFADLPYFYFWSCLIYVLYIYAIESISMWMLYLMADLFIVRNTLLNQHKRLFLKTHFIFKIYVRPCHWNDTSFLAIPNFYFACQSTNSSLNFNMTEFFCSLELHSFRFKIFNSAKYFLSSSLDVSVFYFSTLAFRASSDIISMPLWTNVYPQSKASKHFSYIRCLWNFILLLSYVFILSEL